MSCHACGEHDASRRKGRRRVDDAGARAEGRAFGCSARGSPATPPRCRHAACTSADVLREHAPCAALPVTYPGGGSRREWRQQQPPSDGCPSARVGRQRGGLHAQEGRNKRLQHRRRARRVGAVQRWWAEGRRGHAAHTAQRTGGQQDSSARAPTYTCSSYTQTAARAENISAVHTHACEECRHEREMACECVWGAQQAAMQRAARNGVCAASGLLLHDDALPHRLRLTACASLVLLLNSFTRGRRRSL